jgi:hypothetical protein
MVAGLFFIIGVGFLCSVFRFFIFLAAINYEQSDSIENHDNHVQ